MVTYGDPVIIGVWSQVHLKVGPVTPLIYSVVISPFPEYVIERVILRNFQNPNIVSLIHEMCVVLEGKAKWKQSELHLPLKRLNPK